MPAHADYGTQERLRQAKWILEGDEAPHIRITDAAKLDWYFSHRHIDETQHWAGLRFRTDWTMAGWEFRVIGGYADLIDRPETAQSPDVTLDAKDRVIWALRALPKVEGVIEAVRDVCGMDQYCGPGNVWKLIVGLDALTEHYEGKRR